MIRIGNTKVRTGCYTCKRRRVKCDEGRPACARCVKAGKVCEGYASDPGSGRTEPVKFIVYSERVPSPSLSEHPDISWPQQRALSYFQDRTVLELAGAFQTDFWTSIVLPLARQQSAIRHAVIALSSMHEHYSCVNHYSPIKNVELALNNYGRAMREVVRFNQSQPQQRFEYSLVTCALFSTFESLQGQYHEACNHAIAGMGILSEEQQNSGSGNALPASIPRQTLTRFFIALGRQILELGDPNFPHRKPDLFYPEKGTPVPSSFTSHEHALLSLEILLADIIDYAERAGTLATKGPISDEVALRLVAEFHVIKIDFQSWGVAFSLFSASESNEFSRETPESLSSTPSPSSSIAEEKPRAPRSPAFLVLKVYHTLMMAFLTRIERNDEAAFDEFIPDFETILNTAEEFIQMTSTYVIPMDKASPSRSPRASASPGPRQTPMPPVVRPTFSLALGVVPALFLLASRTSNVSIRDRALFLLRTCNRREGLWDSNLSARMVDRVLELREIAARSRDQVDIHRVMATAPGNSQMTLTAEPAEQTVAYHPRKLHVSPPGTDVSNLSGTSSGPGDIIFKLVDIKFMPGRRCIMRYTFMRKEGERGDSIVIPSYSEHEMLRPGSRLIQGIFSEEMRWEE